MTSPIESRNPDNAQWIDFKQHKAHEFIGLGYSVQWHPDRICLMDIYVPGWVYQQPEYRACVNFSLQPSTAGLDGGRITGLSILERLVEYPDAARDGPREHQRALCRYDRGGIRFLYSLKDRTDYLALLPVAKSLYDDVRRVFNR
ncbi:MAG: hypothetical protein ACREJO_06490 [Phycisphaerales bacterium]